MKHLITSGSLIEGSFGTGRALKPRVGNLEAVVLEPGDNGAFTLRHFWREQTAPNHKQEIVPRPDFRWQAGRHITKVATGAGAICQRRDKRDVHGDFEVVVPEPGALVHYSFDNSAADPTRRVIAQVAVAGPGAVIENRINEHLEAVMLQGASLVHYEFDGVAWHRRAEITNRATGAPALIQSSYNGNLEVIVAEGPDLVLYWRDRAGLPPAWKPGGKVANAGDGPVGFVQGGYGTPPHLNFEVVVPRGDVLDAYWRNNAHSDRSWGPAGWATWGAGPVTAAAMCWSDLGTGCLQTLSQEGSSIYHLHRYRVPDGFRWMRSSCFRLEDTSPVDKSDSPRSVKQAQITGQRDATYPHGTLSTSETTSGIRGTDLGVTVHHNQRTLMLFGDTHWHDQDRVTLDAIGEVVHRGTALPLVLLHGSPLEIIGDSPDDPTSDREYDVPLDAFSLGGQLFTFFSSNHFDDSRVMGRSVLTRAVDASIPISGPARNSPLQFQFLTELSSFRFINVAVQRRRAADVPGMGHEGHVLLVWGTGAYRADDLRLAIIRLSPAVIDRLFGDGPFPTEGLAPIFFNGLSGNTPVWSPIEHDARPLFSQSALGELSVRWVPELGLYVLLSMSLPSQHGGKDGMQAGVFLRVSRTPWGPWSRGREVFNWQRDAAHFIRMTDASEVGDCMFPVQCESHGGAYAPYLFDVRWEGNTAALRYTLSTWNPYQVVLMRHDITRFELRDLTRKDSIQAVLEQGVARSPRLSAATQATLAFGGMMGDRIAANQRNWLLAAPTANPAMVKMFKDRDVPPKEQNLLVWSGEYAGKYLISAVQGLRLTGDRHLRAEIKSVADALMLHQGKGPSRDGYLGPFGIEQAASGRRQRHTADRGLVDESLWDMWGQYHCMLGLYYVYKENGDAAALAACRRAADWFCREFFDNERLETDVEEWQFAREGGPIIAKRMRLLPDGRIEGHQHPHEVYWKHAPDGLSFYTRDGTRTTRFDREVATTPMIYKGKFLLNPSVTHVLTQVYYPAPAQNQACAHIFALLYQETQDPNYLRMLRKLEHAWQLTGGNLVEDFQNGRPLFSGRPQARRWESLHTVQAVAELYLITGAEKYLRALHAIWESIRVSDRHNTGGFSSLEEATGNPYNPRPIETCATVAWAALSVDMLRLTMDARAADELELTTWNAVLGAQNPDGRWWTYDTPMGGIPTNGMPNLTLPPPLGHKPPIAVGERRPARYDLHFQDTPTRGTSHLSCCASNGPRGLGILSEWAVMTATDGGITLNYYGPSAFTIRSPSGRDVSIVQETDYPVSGRISISVIPASVEELRLRLRIPAWSRTTLVSVNGSARDGVVAGEYLTIDRLWSPGDTIELVLDMGPHYVRGGPAPPHTNEHNGGSAEGLVSIYHGPLLLAYDKRLNEHDPMRVPRLLDWQPPVPVEGQPGAPRPLVMLRFATVGGPITLCDFASAGLEFPTPAPQRPNPFVGWQFGRGDGTVIASRLRLQPNGSISGHTHPNEARWAFEGDVLVFYAQNGSPSTRFSWTSIEDGRQILRGVATFDRRIVHVLREDDTSRWTRAWHFGPANGDTIAERLVLVAGGTIAGHSSPNEARWGVEGGTLVFYLNDGRPSTRFQWVVTENGQRILRGAFLPDRSVTHVLSELDTAVVNKVWTFSRELAATETSIAEDMQLLPGGTIAGYSHPNEARWAFEGNTLVFYTAHWVASTRFTSLRMHHGRPEWRGGSVFDGSVTHILRERDAAVTDKLWRFSRKSVPEPGAIDLRLLANHQIDGADNTQESRWDVHQGALVFLAADKSESARFESAKPATSVDMFDFTGVPDRERRMKRIATLSSGIVHELKESNIDLGWVAGSPYVTWFRTRSDQVLARDVTLTAVDRPADTVPLVQPPLRREHS